MLGISYNTVQVFGYKDKDEMEKIHEFEDIKDAIFIEDENVVQYIFDRRNYIRLSDLIFWIETDFIRFRHAQLLQLISFLITKVENMKGLNIEHGFLTLDRIWLCLESQSPCLSIIYTSIFYNVVFTGYQHPLYEECKSQPQNDEQCMKEIIKIIIIRCKNQLRVKNSDQKIKMQVMKEIYNQLLEDLEKESLIKMKLFIWSIFEKQNWDPKVQVISFDEIEEDYLNSSRGRLISSVKQDIALIIKYRGSHQLLLEQIIQQAVKEISTQLNGQKQYKKLQLNEDLIYIWCQEKIQTIENLKMNFITQLEAHLKYQLSIYQKKFKFNPTFEEQYQIIFNSIQKAINNNIRFNYIYNSISITNSEYIENLILKIQELCIITKVEEEVESFISLQILQIIDDLI